MICENYRDERERFIYLMDNKGILDNELKISFLSNFRSETVSSDSDATVIQCNRNVQKQKDDKRVIP